MRHERVGDRGDRIAGRRARFQRVGRSARVGAPQDDLQQNLLFRAARPRHLGRVRARSGRRGLRLSGGSRGGGGGGLLKHGIVGALDRAKQARGAALARIVEKVVQTGDDVDVRVQLVGHAHVLRGANNAPAAHAVTERGKPRLEQRGRVAHTHAHGEEVARAHAGDQRGAALCEILGDERVRLVRGRDQRGHLLDAPIVAIVDRVGRRDGAHALVQRGHVALAQRDVERDLRVVRNGGGTGRGRFVDAEKRNARRRLRVRIQQQGAVCNERQREQQCEHEAAARKHDWNHKV